MVEPAHLPNNAEKDSDLEAITPSSRSCQTGSDDHGLESKLENEDIEACTRSINDQDGEKLNEKVLTRKSTKSSWKDPGPPPDGGTKAWIQVLMGHIVIFNTWGSINSFGVFQAYYTTSLSLSPSSISWIGSVQVFLAFSLGTFAGRLSDGGHFRVVFLLGTILQLLGTFLTSLCTTYPTLFLTQGILTGIGDGLLFCPTLAILSTYFSTRRGVALGIAACGSATGGLVFPAMVQQLLPKLGFAWTIRSVGFLQLGLLVVANAFLRPRLPPRKAGPIVEWAAFKDAEYSLFASGMFFVFWGVYFAFYYISSYARTILDLSYSDSINLLLILNGVGVFGRIIPNLLGDKVTGPFNLLIPAAIVCIILLYGWIGVSSVTGMYVWAVLYGIFGASIQGLFPFALSSLTTDLRKAGTRMGMVFSIVAFAVLTGPPIAGALISADGGSYLGAQLFAGTSILVGCGLLMGSRYVKSGGVLFVKV